MGTKIYAPIMSIFKKTLLPLVCNFFFFFFFGFALKKHMLIDSDWQHGSITLTSQFFSQMVIISWYNVADVLETTRTQRLCNNVWYRTPFRVPINFVHIGLMGGLSQWNLCWMHQAEAGFTAPPQVQGHCTVSLFFLGGRGQSSATCYSCSFQKWLQFQTTDFSWSIVSRREGFDAWHYSGNSQSFSPNCWNKSIKNAVP